MLVRIERQFSAQELQQPLALWLLFVRGRIRRAVARIVGVGSAASPVDDSESALSLFMSDPADSAHWTIRPLSGLAIQSEFA